MNDDVYNSSGSEDERPVKRTLGKGGSRVGSFVTNNVGKKFKKNAVRITDVVTNKVGIDFRANDPVNDEQNRF